MGQEGWDEEVADWSWRPPRGPKVPSCPPPPALKPGCPRHLRAPPGSAALVLGMGRRWQQVPAMSRHLLVHGTQSSGLLPRGQLQKRAPGCSPQKDAPRFFPSWGSCPAPSPQSSRGSCGAQIIFQEFCNCSPKRRFPPLIAPWAETKRGPGLSASIRHCWEKPFSPMPGARLQRADKAQRGGGVPREGAGGASGSIPAPFHPSCQMWREPENGPGWPPSLESPLPARRG